MKCDYCKLEIEDEPIKATPKDERHPELSDAEIWLHRECVQKWARKIGVNDLPAFRKAG